MNARTLQLRRTALRRLIATFFALTALSSGMMSCSSDEAEALYFAGDSQISNWSTKSYFPTFITINDGVSGSGVNLLKQYAGRYQGCRVVVLTGTNDLQYAREHTPEYVAGYVGALERLGASRIYLISILPRSIGDDCEADNRFISQLNHLIRERADAIPSITFIDIFDTYLLDGRLNPAYTTDGLHLSQPGYELLTKTIFLSL